MPPPPSARPSTGEENPYEMPRRSAYQNDPVLSEATTSGDAFSRFVAQHTEKAKANLEEFVGKNLISLIGIVVLILGVGIGAKYAIDNNWISPLMRIIVGYIFGFGLVGLAIKLKRTYHTFSAVLISGGMAIMYFVTYFAYSSYALISQLPTFGLMVMFTAFTVAAALIYSRQVIAHIGLVGAYAVPFLLSNDSGNYLALFIYMAVVNTGILAISLKKNWTPIFYTSSFFTWAIFCGWFFTKYAPQQHFYLALTFLGVFFSILYGSKVVQVKLLKDDDDRTENTITSTVTVGIFLGMCFAIAVRAPLDLDLSVQLLSYVAVASIAIVATSLILCRNVFAFCLTALATWVIMAGWSATSYEAEQHLVLALVFIAVFFAITYGTTLIRTRSSQDNNDRQLNIVVSVLTGAAFYVAFAAIFLDPLVQSSRYWTLFTYLSAASILILATSFKFFERVFVYLVVPFTWVIYASWFFMRYDANQHFDLASIFAALFFATFYLSILYHRLIEDNFSLVEHTSLVLMNAFAFYGFGYALMDGRESLREYLGLFTAANGVLHLVVAFGIRGLKPAAVDVVQVLTVLVLTFASLAVPVQFDGNVVTMAWAIEAAVLFWFGRTRSVRLFERFSYPVMLLATGKLGLDWILAYADRNAVTPIMNSDFITAAVFVVAFGTIYVTNRRSEQEPAFGRDLVRPFGRVIAVVASAALFNMFRMEIGNYFYLATIQSGTTASTLFDTAAGDLQRFNVAWQINYTLFFLMALAAVNLKKLRSTTLAFVNAFLGVIAIGAFATVSMFIFHELRTVFMSGDFDPNWISPWMYVAIRPISYLVAASLLYLLYGYSRDQLFEDKIDKQVLRHGYDAIVYTFVFIVASCELINLMGQLRLADGTKLGLSILWGIYALVLIVIGIARDKKYLRIAAMTLLAITLVKLFFYDISDLDTIPKTILFVTLGITLLVISFLYNKYKSIIFKTDAVQED